jgi:hypothetical protein
MILRELGGGLLLEAKFFSLSLLFDPSLLQGLASSFDLHWRQVGMDRSGERIRWWQRRVAASHEDGTGILPDPILGLGLRVRQGLREVLVTPFGWCASDGAVKRSGDDRPIAKRRVDGVSIVGECVGLDDVVDG